MPPEKHESKTAVNTPGGAAAASCTSLSSKKEPS